MTDREQILTSLRQQERVVTHPPAWETRRRFDNLAERFTASLTAGAGVDFTELGLLEPTNFRKPPGKLLNCQRLSLSLIHI